MTLVTTWQFFSDDNKDVSVLQVFDTLVTNCQITTILTFPV